LPGTRRPCTSSAVSSAVGTGHGGRGIVANHQESWCMDIHAAEDPRQDTRSCGRNPTYVRTNLRMRSGSVWQKRIGSSLPTREPEVKEEGREEVTAKQTVQLLSQRLSGTSCTQYQYAGAPSTSNEFLPMRCIVARPADSSGPWNEMENRLMWNVCNCTCAGVVKSGCVEVHVMRYT
jgi:hypothetical protein